MCLMRITRGFGGRDVLAERRCSTTKKAEWWIRKLAPLYSDRYSKQWRSVSCGAKTVVDFGDHSVFATITEIDER